MEEDAEEEGGAARQKFSLPSLPLLQSWFQDTQQVRPCLLMAYLLSLSLSCWLKASSAGVPPPVVIIVEDFEGFSPHILQDLIMSIRFVYDYLLYIHSLPLPYMMIMSLSTIYSSSLSSFQFHCRVSHGTPTATHDPNYLQQSAGKLTPPPPHPPLPWRGLLVMSPMIERGSGQLEQGR